MIKRKQKLYMKNKYLKHIPFISFLVFLALLYIANVHSAERKMYKIQTLRKELSESEYRLNEVNSKISKEKTASELETKVQELELKTNKEAPIVIEDD